MKDTLKALVGRTRQLESRLVDRVEDAARRWSGAGPLAPLDVVQAIVGAVERSVQPVGRGRLVFPFNDVRVVVAAADRQARAQFDAIAAGPPSLRDRVVERLRATGCEVPDVGVTVAYAAKSRPDWERPEFHLELSRVERQAEAPAPSVAVELVVVAGKAERKTYTITGDRITIGRGVEVRDARQRLLRINQIAFVEGGGAVNDTVSRRHAHIDVDAATGRCRLFDDGSARGTSVIRRGRAVPVPAGARGLLLQPGDEIALGDARLRL